MADCCTNCFYLRTFSYQESGGIVPRKVCAINAPFVQPDISSACWPIIQFPDEWWCGAGCDADSGTPYNASVRPPTGTSSNGTFSLSSESSKTITDANCKAGSNIKIWWLTSPGGQGQPAITNTPGAGSFGVATADGSTVTGTFGYTIYN